MNCMKLLVTASDFKLSSASKCDALAVMMHACARASVCQQQNCSREVLVS